MARDDPTTIRIGFLLWAGTILWAAAFYETLTEFFIFVGAQVFVFALSYAFGRWARRSR